MSKRKNHGRKENHAAAPDAGVRAPALLKEIRRVLNGWIMVAPTGELKEADSVVDLFLQGTFSGTLSSRVFGLSSRTRTYRIKLDAGQTAGQCLYAFSIIGRLLLLNTSPDTMNMLSVPSMRNPSVMVAALKGSDLIVTTYTARTPFAFLNARVNFSRFEKLMTDEVLVLPDKKAGKDKGGKNRS